MKNNSMLAAALVGGSIILASLVIEFKQDERPYGLSASSKGVYVVDKRSGRVRYCLSVVDGSDFVFTNFTYRKVQVPGKDWDNLRAAWFTEQEIFEYVGKVEGEVEVKPDPWASYDDFPPFCTPWSPD
jgi:hypothetical protein